MSRPIHLEDVSVSFGRVPAVRNISLSCAAKEVTAMIGPSGCGKTTLLRCINRMHDLYTHNAVISGKVLLGKEDVYSPQTDTVELRRKVGMIFQKPNPFTHLSIFENVAAGIRLHGLQCKQTLAEQVENNLRRAALWEEVKDRLHSSPLALSGGQQQRLCIARTLAVKPEVFLMDEPCASLDPISTQRIEDLVLALKKEFTIVIVTHNMQQAARISDRTAFILQGELVDFALTSELFLNARDARTVAYLTGKMG